MYSLHHFRALVSRASRQCLANRAAATMGLEKRTIKIIVIVVVTIVIFGGLLGLLLGLLLWPHYVLLEIWPRSPDDYRWDQPLIQFRPEDPGSFHPWIQRTNDFLRVYETMVPESPPRAPCTTRERMQTLPRPPDCDQAMRRWDPCTIDMGYGYPMGTPCVFLRLSHVNYWTPHPYNYSMNLHIPPEMPKHIRDGMSLAGGMDFVWVSCQGEFGADKENIGTIHYITGGLPPGFPLSRLHTADRIPYASRHLPERDPGPLVGVFFKEPRRGVVINVECRIWARDIYYDGTGRTGRTRFEIFVE